MQTSQDKTSHCTNTGQESRGQVFVYGRRSLKRGKFLRATSFVVNGMLVFVLAWFGGCGGFVGSGSGNGSGGNSITGTVVDYATKTPVAGAVVVLEQADGSGTDRVILSTISASNGTFGLNTSSSGVYDVVADATVTPASGPTVTYAATVTFGVPGNASLDQIPLVPEFGSATPTGFPTLISARVSSVGTITGSPVIVDVNLSALQAVSPTVGSVNQLTIPAFAGSTTSVTTAQTLSFCPTGSACASYSLLIPSGHFSMGSFSASGTQYSLSVQQLPNVNYTVEGKAFIPTAPLSPTCTPAIESVAIVLVNGTLSSSNPDMVFTSCF